MNDHLREFTYVEEQVGSICLACGLCCNGVLHAYAVIDADDVERVTSLDLPVETFGTQLVFRQPCPLYHEQKCSAYANRPRVCQGYRCKLLKELHSGAVALEQVAQLVEGAHKIHADVVAQLPAGYLFAQLWQDLDRDYDSGRGLFGSLEQRQTNAPLLLNVGILRFYLDRHFGRTRGGKSE
ncbi:MAG: YkgJ family cysteine cluster protein [Dehalococcoidia bacterium]|nr:YkgJ family cysteine cluster protein [Dehalococcoidia bacterium]